MPPNLFKFTVHRFRQYKINISPIIHQLAHFAVIVISESLTYILRSIRNYPEATIRSILVHPRRPHKWREAFALSIPDSNQFYRRR